MEKKLSEFWDKEYRANNVRRKSLEDLDYITIPDDLFALPRPIPDSRGAEGLRILNSLREKKIVNLTGISNTELKLKYGTANITPLTEYDQNFTMLTRGLELYAEYLHENSDDASAEKLLRFAVDIGSDVSAGYMLLCDLYLKSGRMDEAKMLPKKASCLESMLSARLSEKLTQRIEEYK